MKGSKKNRSGTLAFALLVVYVLLLAFATLDDLLGWGFLRPLFIG